MTPEKSSDRLEEMSAVKRALYELRDLRAKLGTLEQARKEPVAVIGMGCRFPGGAGSPEEYWQLLVDGVDAISEVPAERWNIDEYYDPDPQAAGKISTRWGGFLKDIDQFDPQFFSISPREAVGLDPQQRLLLEVTWEALEHAGCAPDRLVGSPTGVFVGISVSDYFHLQIGGDQEAIDAYLATGSALSVASGRLSYLLGLQGPALSVDTACSSSLAAIHLAVESLRKGGCRMALAGGVNVILLPELLINFSRARMVSADGRCKTFDASADGFVRAEGCGIVVLKRLSDALADKDHILAVIKGSAINQDGRSTGLTAPNGPSQEAVIRSALEDGGIQPHQVRYVEAHGTGTSLGDPIEVQALAAALGMGRAGENRLQVGSVKTNLGHLESAAGIAGLMKAVLMLYHKEIPPHLHLQELNPYIPWPAIPVDVPTRRTPLRPIEGRYICGVSAFGFSGTNVHVVLEAAGEGEAVEEKTERPLHLLTLSAKQPQALEVLAGRYASTLEKPGIHFPNLCFTANAGRAHLNQRLAVVAASAEQAREKLAALAGGQEADGVFLGQAFEAARPEVAFLFTGHGAQYANMGLKLYKTQPTFRSELEKCDAILRPYLDRSILSVLYDPAEQALLDQMAYAQPALFSIEYALAQVWLAWGVVPSIVVGHSLGENVAACIAGAYSLEDGLKLVAVRGRLMDEIPQRGEMVAVFAGEDAVAEILEPHTAQVSIAAMNGPQNTVISGGSRAIQEVVEELRSRRIKTQRLAVAQAAHSPLLDPILDAYERTVATVQFHDLQIGLISGLTGRLATNEEVKAPGYWRSHLRKPVRFAAAMQTLYQEGHTLFLEIGPNPTLLAMGRRCLPEDTGVWLPSLRQGWDDWQPMLESLAALYVQGAAVDWEGFDGDYSRRRIHLPTYPWQRERYWSEQATPARKPAASQGLWRSLVQAGQRQEQAGPLDLSLETYAEKWERLDQLTTAYVARTFHDFDTFTQPGQNHSAAELADSLNILPNYQRLLQRWLARLEREGFLQQDGDRYTCLRPLPGSALQVLSQDPSPALGDIRILVDYIQRSGEKLADILTGRESPLDILFPGGSFQTAEYIYQKWPLLGYYNGILRALIQTILAEMPAKRQLRILEVGAGSGGTTSALLPAIPSGRVHYQFTDVSEVFLNRAKEIFQGYPFVRYSLLDLDVDPQSQGYSPHGYDVIVAANVLHATRDLPKTLGYISSLLAPEGLLLAFEVTDHLSWFDVTTALIEGMGRFEDGLRKDTPLLSTGEWTEVLRQAGFGELAAFPGPGSPAEILGSHVILAQAPKGEGARQADVQFEAPEESSHEAGPAPQVLAGEQEDREGFIRSLNQSPPAERKQLLIDYVRRHLAKALRIAQPELLDRRQRLMDLGVDSLMAVELKSRLQAGLGLERALPSTLVYDYPTIEAVASFLEKTVFGEEERFLEEAIVYPPAGARIGGGAASAGGTNLDELSEAEVEAMLLAKLKDV